MTETILYPLNNIIIDDERIKSPPRPGRARDHGGDAERPARRSKRTDYAMRSATCKARRAWDTRAGHYERKLQTKVGEVRLTLTYCAFAEEHWRRIRTNTSLRAPPALDQATHVCGRRNLTAARLRQAAGHDVVEQKRYLNIGLLKDQQMRGAITV